MEHTFAPFFGDHIFSNETMRQRLPEKEYNEIVHVMACGGNISMETANIVAQAMKNWAVERGATHYTHWFQPLTGITAEKHDSFLSPPQDAKTVLKLTGKQLIMGEPDASSFPSGGLRSTHYARGYTAWDMTSPAFIKDTSAGVILCIPTIFISYTGEALDKKTPLLRSLQAIDAQALRIVRLFGNTQARRIQVNVGAEQEYFLCDREKYLSRRDLIYTGRTLFGAPAPKGQELDDQYFGVIRERVGAFMYDLNRELWKLGIPATTQHNEAAPAQHEMAPIYTPCTIAVDQNQLTMESMKRIATHHGLVCLLHEKPYAGVNGSGKHNNWSICTDLGENLLEPGETPNENMQFLLILSCIIKAVDTHAGLLRVSTASAGNEHRLGAQEAPPAIISIFLGAQLDSVVEQIITDCDSIQLLAAGKLDSGVLTVPVLNKDATDRNRTSPLAFTGNKFEFRMVGSSESIADANVVLNTIVADAFCQACDVLEQADDFQSACSRVIHDNLCRHSRVLFNGDGYSKQWEIEAQHRNLPNLPTTVSAVPELVRPESVALFSKFGVYSKSELEARADVLYENYIKTLKIEATTMLHMVGKHYIPTAIIYTNRLADSICAVKKACPAATTRVQETLLIRCSALIDEIYTAEENLSNLLQQVDRIDQLQAMAALCSEQLSPAMKALRTPVDALELMVDKDLWPVPTYGDLMFEV